MKTTDDAKTVGEIISCIINDIERDQYGKAASLAILRKSVGKPFTDANDVWPMLLPYMPKKYLGDGSNVTIYEQAVYTTLQLYAICMQGLSHMHSDPKFDRSIGKSIRDGMGSNSPQAFDRRFSTLIAADTFEALSHRLTDMMMFIKSNGSTVNFSTLSDDLYKCLLGREYLRKICFKWARDYYAK